MGKGKKIAIISGSVVGGFFLIMLIIGLWATNQPNPYVNNAYGFSVAYPTGWIVNENYNSGAYFVVVGFSSPDNKELIYLRTKQIEQQETISAIAEQTKQTNLFNSREKGFTYTLDTTATIGNKNVRLMEFSLHNEEEIRGQQVIFGKGGTAYLLTYQTNPELFKTGLSKFHQSVASFSPIDGTAIEDYSPSEPVESITTKENTLKPEEPTGKTNVLSTEKVTIDNISYQVVKVAKTSSADGYRANGVFVVITLSMENRGNQPGEIVENNFRLIDSQNRQFGTDGCLCADDRLYNYESINPGLQITKRIVFDVPQVEAEHYLLEISNRGISNSDVTQAVHIDLGVI